MAAWENANKYIDTMLNTLRFLYDWRDACRDDKGKVIHECFLSDPNLKAMERICYGIAAAIYHCVIVKGCTLMLLDWSQDINENHFSHARNWAGGSTDHPTEVQADSAVVGSSVMRILGPAALSKKANHKSVEREK